MNARTPIALATLLLAAAPLLAQYDPKLQYQDRGDRHEGLRPKPVSGYAVALLSARMDPRKPIDGWPDELRLGFYLPQDAPAHITVRQLRSKSSWYWLDKVKADWDATAFNEFTWPTGTVLRRVSGLRPGDLGTIVRLERAEPGRIERVAPAFLYPERPPSKIDAYRFTFKTNGAAHVTCKVYRDGGDKPLFQRPENKEKAGRPFTVRWQASGARDGWYRVVLSGYFDANNKPIDKEVRFYHKGSPGR